VILGLAHTKRIPFDAAHSNPTNTAYKILVADPGCLAPLLSFLENRYAEEVEGLNLKDAA
jgi:hypothetical protein